MCLGVCLWVGVSIGGCVYRWVCLWVGMYVACVLHLCLAKLLSTDQQDKTIVQVH